MMGGDGFLGERAAALSGEDPRDDIIICFLRWHLSLSLSVRVLTYEA